MVHIRFFNKAVYAKDSPTEHIVVIGINRSLISQSENEFFDKYI